MNPEEIQDVLTKCRKDKNTRKEYVHELRDMCINHINVNNKCEVSLNNLGFIYHNFLNDMEIAEEYYNKAVEIGSYHAMCNLGILYKNYYKNYDKAIEWYIKAINAGSKSSMNNLAFIYDEIYNNYDKAIEWYIKAIESGSIIAVNNLYLLLEIKPILIKKIYDIVNNNNFCIEKYPDLYNKLKIYKSNILTKVYGDIKTDNCNICLEQLMGINSGINILLCGHLFHTKCLNNINNCPTCRKYI